MSELTIIHHAVNPSSEEKRAVKLLASRGALAKRRWRGIAEDGREFGFDLDHPISHGHPFLINGDTIYVVEQERESILCIPTANLEQASRIGWSLGNLHFPVHVQPEAIHVLDDPAVVQMLQRENIPYTRMNCVFMPRLADSHHQHEHHHV